MPKPLQKGKTILLFYKEFEADKFFKYDRYIKRILRPLYHRFHRRKKKSGFAVSFELMCRALTKAGYDVRINDYATARKNPDYPVGIVGFPIILENWDLPNPAVLGPSLYDHPGLKPDLMKDPRFKKYAVLAPWTLDMYKPIYGDACFSWFAGIDLEEWPDLSGNPKTYDFLIYDKIRWDHDDYKKSLIDPILQILDKKKLTYQLVRYKMHDHDTFKELLNTARGMIFLCEHETQGLAYQETMASNVPVLAWDRGYWADPLWKRFLPQAPAASSVPFFSPACGEKFVGIAELEDKLNMFLDRRYNYRPREYVAGNISLQDSAKIYAEHYLSLLETSPQRQAT